MFKLLKMLIGILLIPTCWAISMAVYRLYQTTATSGAEAWALPAGFLLWVSFFFLLRRPFRTYVLAHELTHAMWALMMGGRVGKLKIGKTGGHVELSKTNVIITLAPYFFPFYTFLVIAAYYLGGLWLAVEPYKAWWLGVVGLTWAFHITFTINMLTERQHDIQEHGKLFSYAVIYMMNVLGIGIWMILVGTPEFQTFGNLLLHESIKSYTYAFHQCISVWNYIEKLVR